jgi:DNA-binding NtrC family response regulator
MNDVHSLITGPSGSGKGIVARAIGLSRFIPFDLTKGRFIADPEAAFFSVNVAVLPEQLLESVLFGHAKGAFTGAYSEHVGLFESTGENGALFLDEIGEAGGAAQAKLLTVLQERQFQRVGETQSRKAYGRVIAATNRNLEAAVASGTFREDLFFRLSADRLETVALKVLIGGKVESLRPMVNHITRKLLHESWTSEVVAESLQFIENRLGIDYPWPGNFRELEQCLRNFLIHRDYRPVCFGDAKGQSLENHLIKLQPTADELLRIYAKALYKGSDGYKAVGVTMGVDQRTAKKYVQ